MEALDVRPLRPRTAEAIAGILESSWGGTTVVVHAAVYDALDLPALLAEQDGRIVGLLTYLVSDQGLEVVSMDATVRRSGTGTALLAAVINIAKEAGLR